MNRPTTSPRFLARALLALSVTTALLATSQTASAQEVLLIYDVTGQCTPDLQTALTNAGMTVTLSDTSETAYNGTNPSPANVVAAGLGSGVASPDCADRSNPNGRTV